MTIQKFSLYCVLMFGSVASCAASALLNIAVVTAAPKTLASNESAAAVYRVTNNTRSLTSFVMQPIPGITQITTTTEACSNPIILKQGQSCLLNLRIRGNQILKKTAGGPIICNSRSPSFGCSQPANKADALDITSTLAETFEESNTWISILVADQEAPDNTEYVQKTYTLAPLAEQIHLRVVAGANGCPSNATSCQVYADLIAAFRSKFPASILIGFHPDDSPTSYLNWGCTDGDWQCVLSKSIEVMNAVNAITGPGQGFDIFSLEQSYAVPEDAPSLRLVKSCLNPPEAAVGVTCPAGVTLASPVVKFGWVLPSYGGCDPGDNTCDNQYGTDALDYGYPQNYNLGPRIGGYTNLITNGYFPSYSTGCIANNPYPNPLYVVDEDNGYAPYSPEIPCPGPGQTTSNVFTYPNPNGPNPDVSLASSYLAFIMSMLPPISNIPETNGSPVYLMFSGEGVAQAPSLFLGAPNWSLASILQFYNGINSNFSVLYGQYPPPDLLYSNGVFAHGVNATSIKYGIWNFGSILNNM